MVVQKAQECVWGQMLEVGSGNILVDLEELGAWIIAKTPHPEFLLGYWAGRYAGSSCVVIDKSER